MTNKATNVTKTKPSVEANSRRLVDDFVELVKIDSESHNERQMADRLTSKLKELGFENIYEDETGKKIGGNSGNVIGILKGNKKDAPGVLLLAHMDTVKPGIGKSPIIEGDTIRSDGKTVLGADDLAGVVSILEASRMIKNSNVPHGDVYVAFTVSEETGLEGAKNLDISKIDADYCFVIDDDFRVAIAGGSLNKVDGEFVGKAAHAGVEPETGLNSLLMFSKALTKLSEKGLLGRVDHETTSNLIVKEAGLATNIIPEKTVFEGEFRSLDETKLKNLINEFEIIMNETAKEMGGKVNLQFEREFTAFRVEKDHPIISIVERAAKNCNYPLEFEETVGGCDAHEINKKGLTAVLMPAGARNEHTTAENIKISDLKSSTDLLFSTIKEVGKEKKKNINNDVEKNREKGPSLNI